MSPNSSRARCTAAILLAVAAACARRGSDKSDTVASEGAVATDTPAAVVAIQPPGGPVVELTIADKPGVGVFLVDSAGRAVYILDEEPGAPAGCTGDCAKSWTPVTGRAVSAGGKSGANESMIGSTQRSDGTEQVTYNGKPLYYYNGDRSANDTNGQSKKQGGSTGHLVSPQGRAVGSDSTKRDTSGKSR